MSLRKIGSNSGAMLLLDLSSKAIPLVTFPIVVRILGPETYGKVGFALAITGFFGLLSAPGFTYFGAREAASNPGRLPGLIRELMGARIVFALTSYGLLVAYTFQLAPADAATRLLLLLTGLQFVVAAFDLQWVLLGTARSWPIALTGIFGQLTYAAILLSIVRSPSRVWGYPVALVLSAIVVSTIIYTKVKRTVDIGPPVFQPERWKLFIPTCLMLGTASMMSMIYDQLDTVMLKYMRPGAELGIYVADYRIVAIGMSFMVILGQVFFPFISAVAGKDRAQERQYMQWMGTAAVGLALPITAGGFVLSEPLTQLLLGNKFVGSGSLLRLLIFNILAGSLAALFGARLVPNRRESRYMVAVATGAVLNIGLNLIYIPEYGAAAAACTTIVSQLSVALLSYYFTRDLPQPKLFGMLVPSLMSTAGMVIALKLLIRLVHLNVLVLIAVGAAIYGSLMFGWLKSMKHVSMDAPKLEEEVVAKN